MAQHDYVLANQSGLGFRSDANNALAAVVSQNSGAAQPSTTYAYQLWADTNAGLLKIRNAANNGWVSLYSLDGTLSLIPPADGAITLAKLADGVLAASTAGRLKMADEFVTAGKLAPAAVTPAKLSQPFTRATAATASGAAVDFTGIPSWAKRITVVFASVSTTGTSPVQIQIGGSGSVETTGYTGTSVAITSANTLSIASYTSGAVLIGSLATSVRSGSMTIANIDGNQWQFSSINANDDVGYLGWTSAIKTLSATLDRIRLTTVNGTDTFDAGTINITYEG